MRLATITLCVTLFMAKASGQCDCWIEPDTSFTLVPNSMWYIPANTGTSTEPPDDGTIGPITLPFTFQFLGLEFDSVYINTNGILSFGWGNIGFNPNSFPSIYDAVIAPFWGDVDLRGSCAGCNRVSYKLTPTALYVSWNKVGYWPGQTDLLNTFQVVITDGTDPIVPVGNNVRFCYGDMQWATANGNGGANGFGGIPATVGANRGNFTTAHHTQLGRFQYLGSNYAGQYDGNSGISWLDSARFAFSTTDTVSIPPIFGWQEDCDTLIVEVGGELEYEMMALSGGEGETISVVSECATVLSYTELSNTQGEQALVTFHMAPVAGDEGYHHVNFLAQNDLDPVGTSGATIVVQVVPSIPTGLPEHAVGAVHIAPNPVAGMLHYSLNSEPQQRLLEVLSMDGRVAYHGSLPGGSSVGTVNLNNLAPGPYLLKIGDAQRRFIKD